jgi:Spy/CpxP family protein refolding chaperone
MGKIILGVLGFLMLSQPAFAQGPPDKRGWEYRGRRGMMMEPMHTPMMDWASQLNLAPDQTAKILELRESFLRDTLPWRNELVIKRFDFRDMLRDPQADSSAILAKQREISEVESKIQERALLYQLEMRKVLTPDQIKKLPPGLGILYGPPMMPGRGRGMGREY